MRFVRLCPTPRAASISLSRLTHPPQAKQDSPRRHGGHGEPCAVLAAKPHSLTWRLGALAGCIFFTTQTPKHPEGIAAPPRGTRSPLPALPASGVTLPSF